MANNVSDDWVEALKVGRTYREAVAAFLRGRGYPIWEALGAWQHVTNLPFHPEDLHYQVFRVLDEKYPGYVKPEKQPFDLEREKARLAGIRKMIEEARNG